MDEKNVTKIIVKCPGCGHGITVAIGTIDRLRQDLKAMTNERDIYKSRLAALELKKASKSSYLDDLLGRL